MDNLQQLMHELKFYAKWISYGFLIGILMLGMAIHFGGQRFIPRQYGRRIFVVIAVCMIPSLLLPLWLLPLPKLLKLSATALLIVLGLLKYRSSCRNEEAYWQSRRQAEKGEGQDSDTEG